STLDVLRSHPGAFRLVAVAARSRAAELAAVVEEFRPDVVALTDESRLTPALSDACRSARAELLLGPDAAVAAARHAAGDVVLAAIVGAAGLPATAAAVERGAVVALANKESLVVAGECLTSSAVRSGSTLLPVDSEH